MRLNHLIKLRQSEDRATQFPVLLEDYSRVYWQFFVLLHDDKLDEEQMSEQLLDCLVLALFGEQVTDRTRVKDSGSLFAEDGCEYLCLLFRFRELL